MISKWLKPYKIVKKYSTHGSFMYVVYRRWAFPNWGTWGWAAEYAVLENAHGYIERELAKEKRIKAIPKDEIISYH